MIITPNFWVEDIAMKYNKRLIKLSNNTTGLIIPAMMIRYREIDQNAEVEIEDTEEGFIVRVLNNGAE